MFIKKHKNKNQYIVKNGLYIRDFSVEGIRAWDMNGLYQDSIYSTYLENEYANLNKRIPAIDNEQIYHEKIVIVSDGYDFESMQFILAELPKDVKIIAVNGALKKWNMINGTIRKAIDYYVVNNPYNECNKNFIPDKHRYYPKCIASLRTNSEFLSRYEGLKYYYSPVQTEEYSGINLKYNYQIDDYRNPICAALGLSYQFGVKKIALFCCDDSFKEERPSSEKLTNGLWQYPQQNVIQDIIDANAYWFKRQKIQLIDASSGRKYENAEYIKPEISNLKEYFLDA